MVIKVLVTFGIFVLNFLLCTAIVDPEGDVTKPPKQWVNLPWPVRGSKNSSSATGGHIYYPPTLEPNIMRRMSPEDRIQHLKPESGQIVTNSPTTEDDDEWDIVSDPNSEGGFKLVKKSGQSQPSTTQRVVDSDAIIFPDDPVFNVSQEPSTNVLGYGMGSGSIISTGVSVANTPQRPSSVVLGTGISGASIVGKGVSVGNRSQRFSSNVLSKGLQSGASASSKIATVTGRQPQTSHWNIGPAVATVQGNHSPSANNSDSEEDLIGAESNVGWGVSAANQPELQFLPAAHWYASSSAVNENLTSVGDGIESASGHKSSSSLGSTVVTANSSVSSDPTKCPFGATGQYAYRPDCRQFLNCWKGRGIVQVCAPGTLFNPDTRECDFPSKVKCLETTQDDRWSNIEPDITERRSGREGRMLGNTPAPWNAVRPVVQPPTSAPQVKKDCPMAGGTGLAPHPTDCRKFFNCWMGTAHTQQCGPGTLFNPRTLVCDFPYNVVCATTTSTTTTTPTNIGHLIRESRLAGPTLSSRHAINSNSGKSTTTSTTTTTTAAPITRGKVDCPMPGGTGFAPHPTDCSKYLNCWRGTTHTQQCGPGTLFNPQTLVCDFPYNVNCVTSTSSTAVIAPGKFSPNKPNKTPKPSISVATNPPRTTSTTTATTKPTTVSTTKSMTTTVTTTATPIIIQNATLSENPSGQVLRLRGGPGPWEGYVEVQGPTSGWGLVCDEKHSWTIVEATVVCHQLGYERGAELSWQGRPLKATEDTLRVSVNKVSCGGNEATLSACQLEPQSSTGKQCLVSRDAVGVRCYKNWVSQCQPGEVNHGKKCYRLVVPSVRHALEGFSHGEAIRDCKSRGAQLLDIISQEENDFISEWLVQLHPNITNVLTAGVGVNVQQRPLWVWEGSSATFKYSKWWPGWANNLKTPPKTGNRPICVVAKRIFPCEHAYHTSDVVTDTAHSHDKTNVKMCAANYFYWDTEGCSITHGHPYICERPLDDIGCVDGDKYNYQGIANVTASGLPCFRWDDPQIIPKLTYRVSERQRNATLTGHNFCRNVGSDPLPWCYAGKGKTREPCSIPTCWSKEVEKVITVMRGCRDEEFECKPGECIAKIWKCDGDKDCSNGLDERGCGRFLDEVTKIADHRLQHHDKEKWLQTDVHTCSKHCHEAKEFICKSFSHKAQDSVCLLSVSNVGLSGNLVADKGWDYYEIKAHSVQCDNKFICDNDKCVNASLVCNGRNDCGDRSDEKNCTVEYLDYDIRLAGSNVSHEGRIEVKVFGQWGVICDDLFGLEDADVICREVGFPLGAAEVLPPGSYISHTNKKDSVFLVDDLRCRGNETSLRECEFEGWGVHDCLPDEAVSVMCKVPGMTCAPGYWQCETTKECVPIAFHCDNIDDCDDASDEDSARCNLPVELRLVGGSNKMEGRVEVRYHGIWGTVCDDDFAVPAAKVICRSLGFGGPAQAKKDGFFGPGEGQIWLDQLICAGNESSVSECLHAQWGEHNCQHNEDAAVICSPGDVRQVVDPHKMDTESSTNNVVAVNNILPSECGKRNLDYINLIEEQTARVVGGNEVQKGSYPWQASIRVRTAGKSVHWCGAVVISPLHVLTAGHCLQDYTKGAYFVRVGDHDTEEVEGTEQELNIDEIYLHEGFNKGIRLNHDIAVVKLKGLGIRLGPEVMPACLPNHGIQYAPGLNCTISGWGSVKAAGSGYSRRLRSTWIPLLPHETCKASFVYGTKAIGEGMFCAGMLEGGVDSCQGDSGGPMVCHMNGEFTLYGITSWGHGCGRPNKPGVYSNVGFYRDWIDNKLEASMTGR
ncbi:uncharacterized protein teq isoform X2 [Periplaneta americana]|uniref:uncharacterized protein teq isoform X2 n=1 Tax=Periplaneta americana TaxID=6978 RepID=UPI0037E84A8B